MLASISMASPDEPASQGHSLSYWLEHYSLRGSDADRKIAEKAEIAIREIGTNALPALLVWLRYEPSQTKTNIQHFLAHLRRSSYGRWVPASLTYDHGVPPAQVGFMVLGPAAAEAIPELEKIANDATNPIPAARAMAALSAIGLEALPAVESRLANTNFPFPPDAAVNMYLRTRTSTAYHQLSATDVRPILLELRTNANPVLVTGAIQLLAVINLPSSRMRGETKSFSEALSDLRTEREMGSHLKPGWNVHPRDKLSPEQRLAASNTVHAAMTKPPSPPRGDEPYPYPLRPGSAAWNYAEVGERLKSVDIPKSWRDHATGWQLFLSAIANPYFRGIGAGGTGIASSYQASRRGTVSILSEVDTSPDFGTNVLRWFSSLDLENMAAVKCFDSDEPCFMDYKIVCYMAGLDSALETLDIASRQKLFRLAVWDADYFLSTQETFVANGPICLVYAIYNKPDGFRGQFPDGLILPKMVARSERDDVRGLSISIAWHSSSDPLSKGQTWFDATSLK